MYLPAGLASDAALLRPDASSTTAPRPGLHRVVAGRRWVDTPGRLSRPLAGPARGGVGVGHHARADAGGVGELRPALGAVCRRRLGPGARPPRGALNHEMHRVDP